MGRQRDHIGWTSFRKRLINAEKKNLYQFPLFTMGILCYCPRLPVFSLGFELKLPFRS